MRCHDSSVRHINNVLCCFGKLDSVTKFRLLTSYCFSLWSCFVKFCNRCVESVCSAWRVGIRRVWGLPSNADSVLLPLLCCRLPLYDELMKRLLTFTQKCFNCDNKLANIMVRYAV